jgi:metal-sulfur cluster biosynthetic enzyme
MTTETLAPESTAHTTAPAIPSLTVVRDPGTDCSTDQADHDQAHHGQAQHEHSDHVHGGGCCATTSPVAAAAAAEKAVAMAVAEKAVGMAAACESESNTAGLCEIEASSPQDAPIVDDAALIEALREVIDPELMINIVDLGLVYSINHTDRKAQVEMTLTSPACPAGPQIISQAKMSLEKIDGIDVAEIKLTMSPPWTPARMTDEARDQLGIF